MNEHKQRPLFGVGRKSFAVDIQKIDSLPHAARPPIQARFSIETIFDRPHERLGAQPGDAQFGIFLDLLLGLLTQPLRCLALGGVDDRIGEYRPRSR